MYKKERVGAVIVAAGRSERMEGIDKVFSSLGGEPVLAHSVDVLERSPLIDQIIIVLKEKDIGQGLRLVAGKQWRKVTDACPGGKRRQDSVLCGLRHITGCKWVVIHDGARPFLTEAMIEDGLEAAQPGGAAVAAVPVKDTIKRTSGDGFVIGTPPRQNLWAVQTPQVFRFDIITRAYSGEMKDVTDDAMLVEETGVRVKVFKGSYDNIKITTHADLELAQILRRKEE